MMPESLRHHASWLRIGWLLVGADVYLSLSPSMGGVGLLPDKLAHFLVYAVLAFWFATLYPGKLPVVVAALGLLGGSLEILQGLGGERHAEWLDLASNLAGCLVGPGIVAVLPFNAFQWFESRLSAAPP